MSASGPKADIGRLTAVTTSAHSRFYSVTVCFSYLTARSHDQALLRRMPFSWRWQFLRQLATDRREAMHASSASSLSIERRFRATLRAKVPHTNARNNWLHRRQVGRERAHIGRPSSEEPPSENLWQGLFGSRMKIKE